jgi:hypothetical protein
LRLVGAECVVVVVVGPMGRKTAMGVVVVVAMVEVVMMAVAVGWCLTGSGVLLALAADAKVNAVHVPVVRVDGVPVSVNVVGAVVVTNDPACTAVNEVVLRVVVGRGVVVVLGGVHSAWTRPSVALPMPDKPPS